MNRISNRSQIADGSPHSQGDQALLQLHLFLAKAIVTGYPNIALAARGIGISVRSLQRQLNRNGTSYSRVVAGVRFQMAHFLLLHSSNKVIDIALGLGYSDAAAFSRAFGRWAGVCPQQYRNRGRSAEQSSAILPFMIDTPLPFAASRAA